MREFQVNLTKSLAKGLIAFTDNELNILMLHECHNQMPGETGLLEYEALEAIGWRGAYFNYLIIEDQTGKTWYWYPVFDGHILSGPNVPSEPSTGLDATPLLPYPVQWVEVKDENGGTWKLYPDPSTGETRATDDTPLSGIGIADMVWRGTTTELWTNHFRDFDKTRYAEKV